MQQFKRIINAELQPIQAVGITAEVRGRFHVIPRSVAVAMPHAGNLIEARITMLEPLTKLSFGRVAITIHLRRRAAIVCVLIPQVVAEKSRMIAVTLDEGDEKLLRLGAHFGIIEAQSGEAAGRAAAANAAIHNVSLAVLVSGPGPLAVCPLGRIRNQFRNHHLDPVLRRQIHHPVVIAPVVLARRGFDGAPHEPVPERVHTDTLSGGVIASPVLLRRIRFAEVHCAVREDRLVRRFSRTDREGYAEQCHSGGGDSDRSDEHAHFRNRVSGQTGSAARLQCRSIASQTRDFSNYTRSPDYQYRSAWDCSRPAGRRWACS